MRISSSIAAHRMPLNLAASLALLLISIPGHAAMMQQDATPDQPALAAPAATATMTASSSSLPDAPMPSAIDTSDAEGQSTSQPATAQSGNGQTHRILGIIPNFRAATTNEKLPPQSVKEKFITASEDSFDYSSVVFPAVIALYGYEDNKYPEFGKGGVGYGRYLWHAAVDQTVENYMVEFIVPAIAHEDTRYYTLGHGGFLKRSGYSLSRAVITRSDSGKPTFNSGEVVGAALGAALSNAYYPAASRSVSNTMTQWGTNVGIDAGVFLFKEFWPDISYHLLHSGPRPGTTPDTPQH